MTAGLHRYRATRPATPAVPTRPVVGAAGERGAHAFLAEVGRRLSGSLNERRCLRAVAELAVAYLADAAVVVGPPERPHPAWVRLAAGGRVEERPAQEHEIGEVPGLAEALAGFPPVPSRPLAPAAVPGWLLPDGTGPVGGLLLVPLPGNAGPGGALVLARRADRQGFSGDDEKLTRTFAERAGAAVSAAALYREQAEAMAVLQADLLPPQLPQTDAVELVGSYQPAEHGLLIGGDFYDVFPPAGAGSETVVVLGDVCGKGAQAAALTGKVRQTLRALHLVEQRPATLLRVLNQALLQPGQSGLFVTLVVASMAQQRHGRVRLTFATGGHPAPLVLRHHGTVEEVPAAGTLIGVVPELRIRTASVELAPGDLCLLYSDGMTEARGGAAGREQYGEHRLRQALHSCHGMSTGATVERLRQLVADWVHGGIQDDIAMVAIRAGGTRQS